jgi:D-glycero-D-manno-heptose 1,7-bisphosphate phosphatase
MIEAVHRSVQARRVRSNMNRAVFFDRDGVINRIVLRGGKICSPRCLSEFEILPGARDALERSRAMGFLNIVITNQPDIARGLMPVAKLESMHRRIREALAVDDIVICPHDDADRCDCRKPRPGMLLAAAWDWKIDLKASFVIGDQWKDVEAGKAAGCTTILIDYPHNQATGADVRVQDLAEALRVIEIETTQVRVSNG